MRTFLTSLGLLLLVLVFVYHFAALSAFNLLVPKDGGVARIAADVAYGPHLRHRLDLYRPGQGQGPFPVLLFVYGGSWDSGR